LPTQKKTNQKGRETLLGAQRRAGKSNGKSSGAKPGSRAAFRFDWIGAAAGLILGVLLWQVSIPLGIQAVPFLRGEHWMPAAGLAGGLIGGTRFRPVLWGAAGAVVAALLVICYTPLVVPAIRGLVRRDPLRPVEAVVVLSSDIKQSGALTPLAQSRLLRGYEVLQAGYARRLVLTRMAPPKPSYIPVVTRQMQALGLSFPIDQTEIVGVTYDEARAVKRLAKERGWREVILVTSPSHSRRAAATFEKAGLRVLSAPCEPLNYDLPTLSTPDDRMWAFRDWLYETVGWYWYRMQGRL
jgi:uncharacterized SAM-binding protein YcdF (DUF218 family)